MTDAPSDDDNTKKIDSSSADVHVGHVFLSKKQIESLKNDASRLTSQTIVLLQAKKYEEKMVINVFETWTAGRTDAFPA